MLIALGGGVAHRLHDAIFQAIGINAEWFVQAAGCLPCGAMGAVVVIGSWLVEAKQSVIESMAPVLTRLFTPLFTIVLLVFLGTVVVDGQRHRRQARGADLASTCCWSLVVGLRALRDLGARSAAPPDFFDRLQLAARRQRAGGGRAGARGHRGRITEFGFTPNRVAALGENLILLVNLLWSAWLYARFLRGGDRSRRSNAGRPATCPSTPPGPPSSSSCSRRCLRLPERVIAACFLNGNRRLLSLARNREQLLAGARVPAPSASLTLP